jgi:hypothetical protein
MFGKKKQFSSASPCSAEVLNCSCVSLHFLITIAYQLNLLRQDKITAALHNSYLHSIERSCFEWKIVNLHYLLQVLLQIFLGSKLSKVTTIIGSCFNISVTFVVEL